MGIPLLRREALRWGRMSSDGSLFNSSSTASRIRSASEILVALHDAVLACQDRARSAGARRVIRTADERGGYVLFSGKVYFILKVDEKSGIHVVSTVMTPATMSK